MKYSINLPKLVLSSVVVLLACVMVSIVIPEGYIPLPEYVQRFDNLHHREMLDAARYTYRSAAFGVVYGIVNILNSKLYVGSTGNTPVRFYEHLISGQNSNLALQRAIQLYGIQYFSLVIFELFYYPIKGGESDKRAIFDTEQRYLDMFPQEQKYNFATRADGVHGRVMSDEERREVSARMTGRNVGRAPINKGVKVSDVMRKVMRTASAHRYHEVYIYDDMFNLVAWYPSISEAVRVERTQKNKFMAHIKNGTIWRGYTMSRTPR